MQRELDRAGVSSVVIVTRVDRSQKCRQAAGRNHYAASKIVIRQARSLQSAGFRVMKSAVVPDLAIQRNFTVPSALMRSPHDLHSVFDVAPLPGFFGIALVLASLGILGRLGDSLEAVLFEHLTRDHMNLHFGYHVALLLFHHARNRRNRSWPRPDLEVSILFVQAYQRL